MKFQIRFYNSEAETVRMQKLQYYLNFKIAFRMNAKLKVEQKTCEIWLKGHHNIIIIIKIYSHTKI